jgi:hypothetical protein
VSSSTSVAAAATITTIDIVVMAAPSIPAAAAVKHQLEAATMMKAAAVRRLVIVVPEMRPLRRWRHDHQDEQQEHGDCDCTRGGHGGVFCLSAFFLRSRAWSDDFGWMYV